MTEVYQDRAEQVRLKQEMRDHLKSEVGKERERMDAEVERLEAIEAERDVGEQLVSKRHQEEQTQEKEQDEEEDEEKKEKQEEKQEEEQEEEQTQEKEKEQAQEKEQEKEEQQDEEQEEEQTQEKEQEQEQEQDEEKKEKQEERVLDENQKSVAYDFKADVQEGAKKSRICCTSKSRNQETINSSG